MRQNVTRLEQFYTDPLGVAAQTMVLRRLHSLWPHLEGLDVLGYGYGLPYLKTYQESAHRLIYAMPASQGVVQHAQRRGNTSLLVHENELPFRPSIFDRVLVTHGLEEARQMPTLLKELWRVMKPEGRIVIVAANRAGLWARSDKTPFGTGRPFSRGQLSRALKTAGFVPVVRAGALYCPPV
ncbi:MAG: methyltransferase domain-containing protein, partial [Robiginitomaculum sp.]|nr:methyltransferase domain-containing protein [Robiginitomaculum sp.]